MIEKKSKKKKKWVTQVIFDMHFLKLLLFALPVVSFRNLFDLENRKYRLLLIQLMCCQQARSACSAHSVVSRVCLSLGHFDIL